MRHDPDTTQSTMTSFFSKEARSTEAETRGIMLRLFSQLGPRLAPFHQQAHAPSRGLALLLSIALHAGTLLLAGLLVMLLKGPGPGADTLVFQFVFAPSSGEQEGPPAQRSNDRNERQFQAAAPSGTPEQLSSQVSSREPLPPAVAEESTHRVTEDIAETPSAAEESSRPAVHDMASGPAAPLSALLATSPLPVVDRSLPAPQARLLGRRADLVPARLPMPVHQRKAVVKKIRKLLARHDATELSDTTIVWQARGQSYEATFHYQPSASPTGLDEMVIDVSTERGGHAVTTQLRMRRLAFSSFAQFVDYWNPRVAIHDDELDGRFHTNTTFNVSSSYGVKPKFRGKVTTAAYEVRNSDRWPFFDADSIFSAGIEMGVDVIRLPRSFTVFLGPNLNDSAHVQTFTEETWVTFLRHGSFTWHTRSDPRIGQRTLPAEPFYIVGGKKAAIHVKGVVSGKVLVYSARKIIIDDDLTYARPPELWPGSADYLGLVSEKDIDVADPKVTGPGDLHIYAAILARGRFRVRKLWSRRAGTLSIYGSLSAGTLSATEPRYATKIRFDKRLNRRRPPRFPMTNRFEIVDWDRQWKVSLP